MTLSQGMITIGVCNQDNKRPKESNLFGIFFQYIKSEKL